jgi:hypothetical protein
MCDDFLDPTIKRSIAVLVESEASGTAAAAFAERHARCPRERAVWAALYELEEQTRIAVNEHLGDTAAQFGFSQRLGNALGPAGGAAVAVMPHRVQMRSLVLATKPFLYHFRKLKAHFANSPHAAFFDYVLAHELAIAELGRGVLAHTENPLAPVEALLGNVPIRFF